MTDIKCLKCKNNETGICNRCDMCYDEFDPIETPPITNAARIRNMTDEELADWFSIYCCRNKTYDAHCETFRSCKTCWFDWLNGEVTE